MPADRGLLCRCSRCRQRRWSQQQLVCFKQELFNTWLKDQLSVNCDSFLTGYHDDTAVFRWYLLAECTASFVNVIFLVAAFCGEDVPLLLVI